LAQEYLAPIQNSEDLWGYIDETGQNVIPFKYFFAENFSEGMAYVFETGNNYSCLKAFYINAKGEKVIDLKNIQEAEKFDMWGSFLFDKGKFNFNQGLAPIIDKKNKWGFIDKTGKLVIPCQYDEVGYFSEDLCYAVMYGKMTGYITKDGAWKIELEDEKFENTACFYRGEPFKNGLAKLSSVDKTGICDTYESIIIDKTGKIIVQNAKNIGSFSKITKD